MTEKADEPAAATRFHGWRLRVPGVAGTIRARVGRHDWFAVLVELVVVVLGILFALQLNAWKERRAARELEQVYLARLTEDLQIEESRIAASEVLANDRIAAARLLGRLAADPSAALEEPRRVPWAIETAGWRSFPQINAFVYRELQTTGRLVLIRSDRLRRSLAEHYTTVQHDARVGEELITQQRFDAAVAGLLSMEELEDVERFTGHYVKLNTSPERALALAEAFGQRTAAIAELPGLVQHHTFNLRVLAQMRARADRLMQQIDSLSTSP